LSAWAAPGLIKWTFVWWLPPTEICRNVKRNEFRSDLYYRLNVFPIPLPPLRERREDIPALVKHYVEIYARRMNKQIECVCPETMRALVSYQWPGNIRELQNFIERSVTSLPGHSGTSSRELDECRRSALDGAITLEDAERDHIRKLLSKPRWVVAGRMGGRTFGSQEIHTLFSYAKAGHLAHNKNPFRRSRVGITREPIFSDLIGNSNSWDVLRRTKPTT